MIRPLACHLLLLFSFRNILPIRHMLLFDFLFPHNAGQYLRSSMGETKGNSILWRQGNLDTLNHKVEMQMVRRCLCPFYLYISHIWRSRHLKAVLPSLSFHNLIKSLVIPLKPMLPHRVKSCCPHSVNVTLKTAGISIVTSLAGAINVAGNNPSRFQPCDKSWNICWHNSLERMLVWSKSLRRARWWSRLPCHLQSIDSNPLSHWCHQASASILGRGYL